MTPEALKAVYQDSNSWQQVADAVNHDTPTTKGEWTPEWLANFGKAETWLESICYAHNSALAAAEHKWNLARLTDIKELTDKYAEQLAAAQAAMIELLTEIVEESAVQFEDIRIDYKTVQITSSTWDKLQAWHAAKIGKL